MKTIGYAIVGTGYFGSELGRFMSKQKGARISAVLDPNNADSIAKELDCDIETDLDSLFERKDVDAVIIATPNYLHKEPVMKAAAHKVHVFCEKPIALSYEDCNEMITACTENNIIFMAGHLMNFFRGVRHAKAMIQEGVIGDVLYCHSARNGWEETQPAVSWKKVRSKSGGHLYHHIHELDCIQFIMGSPLRVYMSGGNVVHNGAQFGDEDDMLFINLEFDNNRYAVLEYGSAFRWSEHYLLIQGTKGAIKIDMKDVKMTLRTGDQDQYFFVHETKEEDDDRSMLYNSYETDGSVLYGKPGRKPPKWLDGLMAKEMQYFNGVLHGESIDEEFRPLFTGEAAKNVIATADALTLAMKEKRIVDISEIIKK